MQAVLVHTISLGTDKDLVNTNILDWTIMAQGM